MDGGADYTQDKGGTRWRIDNVELAVCWWEDKAQSMWPNNSWTEFHKCATL